MTRGIDHLVLVMHDLQAGRSLYERLGFTLTPVARHPFGTENSLVQLQGCFLELLAVADKSAFPTPEPGAFSFPRFNDRFLNKGEGLSMLVLDSADAIADGRRFAAGGIQAYLPFEFGRDAKQPDGSTARVGFKLAFATDPSMPDLAFFTCQQLAPEFFWKPDYQRHPNTARAIAEVVLASLHPQDHSAFFETFCGTVGVSDGDGDLVFTTARGRIRISTPDRLSTAWGRAADLKFGSPRFVGYVVGVDDITATEACLERAGVAFDRVGARLIGSQEATHGVAIAFEQVDA